MNDDFEKFKNRQIKAKGLFYVKEVDKPTAYEFVKLYHYLGDAKFFAVQSFGLFHKKTNRLVGVATYSLPQGTCTPKSWFSLSVNDKNIYELSRLCMVPELNGTNATSYLLGASIRELKKQKFVRAVITLACSDRHVGSIYQVCNFKYYGLSEPKNDFYIENGGLKSRGATKNIKGAWLPRARKHRYAYILDETLRCNYEEQPKPSVEEVIPLKCCNGTLQVHDGRFDVWYTCPKCTGVLKRIEGC